MFDGILSGCHISHPNNGIWNWHSRFRILHNAFDAQMGEADEFEKGEAIIGPKLGKLVGWGHFLASQFQCNFKCLNLIIHQ